MWMWEANPQNADRRRVPRRVPAAIACSEGRLVDLSCAGAQVLRSGELDLHRNDCLTVVLQTEAEPMELQAVVAWTERVAAREYVFGLVFVHQTESQVAKLQELVIRRCSGGDVPLQYRAA